MLISFNNAVRRQTYGSKFSCWSVSEDPFVVNNGQDLLDVVEAAFKAMPVAQIEEGRKAGFLKVPTNGGAFFSAVKKLEKGDSLKAEFAERFDGEDPFIQTTVVSDKTPAKSVDLILYTHEALKHEASTDAAWELVSINAKIDDDETPTPVAMARNFLELNGGTKREYTAREFAEAIIYWSTHAMCQ